MNAETSTLEAPAPARPPGGKYVTVAMLAEHAHKCPKTIRRGMKAAGIKGERFPGVHGLRLPLKEANAFLARHWPGVKLLSLV